MTQAVKRACDACHRRKVKCDGLNPCRNCNSSQLGCTYNAIPQKKGPKGSRAKVISELRETQRQTSLLARLHCRITNRQAVVPPPSGANPAPGYIHADLVKQSIHFFFTKMYATMPILEHNQVTRMFNDMDKDAEAYSLIAALCAFVLYQPGMHLPGLDMYMLENVPSANMMASELLMDEAIRVRRGYDYISEPTLGTMVTSYFLASCHKMLDLRKRAWFYLRETATMFQVADMGRDETYHRWSACEAYRRRCLYWQVLATERLLALQEQYPISLQPSITPPEITDETGADLTLFSHLVSLSRPLEDTIISVWKKLRQSTDIRQVESLRRHLTELVASLGPQDSSNFADYQTIQSWLTNLSWEFQHTTIQSAGDQHAAFSGVMAQILTDLPTIFPDQGMEIMGNAVLDTILNMALAALPALSVRPMPRNPAMPNPHKLLQTLLEALAALRMGNTRFIPLVLFQLVDVLAFLCDPMLNDMPDIMASLDLFDGFGNAGLAQSPAQMFDQKFSLGDVSQPPPPSQQQPQQQQQQQQQQHPPQLATGGVSVPQAMTSPFSTASPTSISSSCMEMSQQSLSDFSMPDMMAMQQQAPRSQQTPPQQTQIQQMRLGSLSHSGIMPAQTSTAPAPQQAAQQQHQPPSQPQQQQTQPPPQQQASPIEAPLGPVARQQTFKTEPTPQQQQFTGFLAQQATQVQAPGNAFGMTQASPTALTHAMPEFHMHQHQTRGQTATTMNAMAFPMSELM
ncbi:hypothetical protein Cpir12675_004853 [Ceratocystis pirilliformis]|uniref:Zn(2)-C6 fungal-type domain-containing protein n=1 Tax=Ceratocystis pirilliformis TaxID=259994 RepID=A0ABR3YUW0_9PEZI